jgi:hypothetical protein
VAELHAESVETLRQLTVLLMLMSTAVFSIGGGFASIANKKNIRYRWWLLSAMLLLAASAVVGYMVLQLLITQFGSGVVDPHEAQVGRLGSIQISTFVFGGVCFIVFVFANAKREPWL